MIPSKMKHDNFILRMFSKYEVNDCSVYYIRTYATQRDVEIAHVIVDDNFVIITMVRFNIIAMKIRSVLQLNVTCIYFTSCIQFASQTHTHTHYVHPCRWK